ncbi:hypothetical protein HPP92_011603 [Vanilla planifolia]|uniref:Uncharacterized protein n=1 Tax=Vanilla planifolia TaxID=51239 RepID=A0A835V1Y9_VANPL|nr:hypothetical protein HPP92_011603 [Vanilla planifolia]
MKAFVAADSSESNYIRKLFLGICDCTGKNGRESTPILNDLADQKRRLDE